MVPTYLKLLASGELARRVTEAARILEKCTLCPRQCKVNRLSGETGFCKGGQIAVMASAGPHHGEEPPLSGSRGSGTIFFTGCNLKCLFCQNYQISQLYEGQPITNEELGKLMLSLQKQGCHNINLVSPTHFLPQIIEALLLTAQNGLRLPLVYNTNGYDTIETLKLLDGVVDIYLPDIKYSNNKLAEEYSEAKDYVQTNRLALKEMYRQVGNLKLDKDGVAERGLIIRHLVLPEMVADSLASLDFISQEISRNAYISLMAQYHPCHRASDHPVLNRRLKRAEYRAVVQHAESLGLDNCYTQSLTSSDNLLPDFQRENPFASSDK